MNRPNVDAATYVKSAVITRTMPNEAVPAPRNGRLSGRQTEALPLHRIAQDADIARTKGPRQAQSSKCERGKASYFSDRIAIWVVFCGREPAIGLASVRNEAPFHPLDCCCAIDLRATTAVLSGSRAGHAVIFVTKGPSVSYASPRERRATQELAWR